MTKYLANIEQGTIYDVENKQTEWQLSIFSPWLVPPRNSSLNWFSKVHWEKHWGYEGYTDLGQWQIMKYKTVQSKIISKIQYRPCNVHISICCAASNLMTNNKFLRTYSVGRWYKQYINSFSSVIIYGVFFLTRITRIIYIFFSVAIVPVSWNRTTQMR